MFQAEHVLPFGVGNEYRRYTHYSLFLVCFEYIDFSAAKVSNVLLLYNLHRKTREYKNKKSVLFIKEERLFFFSMLFRYNDQLALSSLREGNKLTQFLKIALNSCSSSCS